MCCACGTRSHKQKKCSLNTKHEIERMDETTWKCRHCRPAKRAHKENEAEEKNTTRNAEVDVSGDERKSCKECKGYIKRGDKHLECNKCKKPSHKKSDCSGMSRDRLRMIREASWICKECKDPVAYARAETRRREGDGKKANCFICGA